MLSEESRADVEHLSSDKNNDKTIIYKVRKVFNMLPDSDDYSKQIYPFVFELVDQFGRKKWLSYNEVR